MDHFENLRLPSWGDRQFQHSDSSEKWLDLMSRRSTVRRSYLDSFRSRQDLRRHFPLPVIILPPLDPKKHGCFSKFLGWKLARLASFRLFFLVLSNCLTITKEPMIAIIEKMDWSIQQTTSTFIFLEWFCNDYCCGWIFMENTVGVLMKRIV